MINLSDKLTAKTIDHVVADSHEIEYEKGKTTTKGNTVADELTNLAQQVRYLGETSENPEFIRVYTDDNGRFLWGINHNGNIVYGYGIPSQIQSILNDIWRNLSDEQEFRKATDDILFGKLSDIGVSLIDESYLEITVDEAGHILSRRNNDGSIEYFTKQVLSDADIHISEHHVYGSDKDSGYIHLLLDSQNNILEGTLLDGTKVIFGELRCPTTDKLSLDVSRLSSDVLDIRSSLSENSLSVLILGDSYSQFGGAWANPMLSYLPKGSSFISLAVSSASVKDRYTDRELYPYSDRPVPPLTKDNLNTLCCQISKLHRLVDGEARGIIYTLNISKPTGNGTLTIQFKAGISESYIITENMTVSDVVSLILSKDVAEYSLKRTTSENVILVEHLIKDNTGQPTITAENSCIVVTSSLQQSEEPDLSDYYPDVIVIEGGMNDWYDSAEVEATYSSQIEKVLSNVYVARKSNPTLIEKGTASIVTPIEEVNRTCFAGAYRYMVEELHKLYPNAQIFFTITSGLGYRTNNCTDIRYRQSQQQKKCAELFSASIIDWHGEGQINYLYNPIPGSGTQEDPYIWDSGPEDAYADTGDAMHPNTRGGKKYGRLAALTIKQKFLSLKNI